MGSVFFGVLYGFWTWLLGFFLLAIFLFGTHRLLLVPFGSICLDAFWRLSLGLSLDFIFF